LVRVTHVTSPVTQVFSCRGSFLRASASFARPVSLSQLISSPAPDALSAERLRRSEEKLRLAARAANDVIWDWDATTNEAQWSEALRTVFGWDPDIAKRAPEGPNCWWTARVHPDDRRRVVSNYDEALASPATDHWECEYRFRRSDDGWAVVIDRAFLVRDEHGRVTRAVGAMQDVTMRTTAMTALRESEARFRALVEVSTSAVWRTDPDGNVVVDLPEWRALTGLSREAILGRGWMRAVHPDDLDDSKAVWRHARDTGRSFEVEQRLRIAAGCYRWFHCRGVPVLDSASGAVREWVGMHEDIDDRRRAEAAERFLSRASVALNGWLDYERTLRTLAELALEELADGCVVHMVRADGGFEVAAIASRDARRQQLAVEMETRFPSNPDALVGHPTVIRTGQSRLLPTLDERTLEAYATSPEHLVLLRELGLHSGLCVPIIGLGGVLGAMTMVGFHDVRDRVFSARELAVAEELGRRAGRAIEHAREFQSAARARQVAEEASQAKSDFLAVLSHEIRTPLNAIVGYAHLLADAVTGPVSDEQHTQLRRIVSSAEHLRVLIDEILTMSRIEAGREEIHLDAVDLCSVVDEAIDIVALAASAKGLRLVRDVPAVGCVVTTDRTKLLQAVVNLAGNAVKFTERGEISFIVRDLDHSVEINVSDTGVGIAPEHQRRIFEPFWQVDQRANQAYGGIGLGLSVVRHVMQLLGGGVRAESRAGEGSRFTLWMPRSQE
jgi:PAS domain S-box-containing protein